MKYPIIVSIIVAFGISAILGPIIIPILRKLKAGQTEREELESHQKKTGTPTMGGLMILPAVTVTSLVYSIQYPKVIPVLILTLGFGVIGFIDDYLKVVLKRSDGLIAWQKLILEFIVTGAFAWYIKAFTNLSLEMIIPFSGGKTFDMGVLAIPFMFIVVLATVNGVNFTDGVDGLASCVTVVVAGFITVVSFLMGAGIEPISGAVCGALMGFLLFNAYPAKVFMGDTGSLALGGFVAACAYMMNMPWFILIFGLIYAVELLSVVIQVTYFKATHGKRIFKMSPIHHHFELSGWSETKVVTVFTIITIIMCLICFVALGIF